MPLRGAFPTFRETEDEEEFRPCRVLFFFFVKNSVRQLAGGSSSASRQERFTRRLLPPMARTLTACEYANLKLVEIVVTVSDVDA